MKRLPSSLLTLLVLFTVTVRSVDAQTIDVTRNLPTGGPVVDFAMLGDATVLAIRRTGEILRSLDTARSWSLLTTRDPGDALHCLLVTDAGVIASTRGGSILRSTDGGAQWNTLHRLPAPEWVTDLTTGDGALFALSEGGTVLRSDDEGTHWVICATVPMSSCTKLLRTSDTSFLVGSARNGLLRSTDDGRSWQRPTACPPSVLISDLAVCPCGGLLASMHDYGCHHSTDGGDRWDSCFPPNCAGWAPGIETLTIAADSVVVITADTRVQRLHPHEGGMQGIIAYNIHPACAVAGLSDGCLVIGDSLGGIHRTLLPPRVTDSTDLVEVSADEVEPLLRVGDHFTVRLAIWRYWLERKSITGGRIRVFNELTGEEIICDTGVGPFPGVNLRIDIPEHAADGRYRLLCSVVDGPCDRGIVTTQYFTVHSRETETETRRVFEAESRDCISILHGTPAGDIYYACERGVLMHSADRGTHWRNLLPPRYADQCVCAVAGDVSSGLYTILGDLTLILSRDGGESWQEAEALGDSAITAITCRGARVLVNTKFHHVLFSTDGARTWKDITPYLGLAHGGMYLPSDDRIILVYRYGFHESTDGGDTWTIHPTPYGNPYVKNLFVDAEGTYHIPYACALYRSTDFARSWKYVLDRDLKLGYLDGIDQTGDGNMFGILSTLMVSTDGGAHWENDAVTSDTLQVRRIAAAGDDLFISTRRGELYRRGAKSTMFTRGQPAQPATCRIVSTHPNPVRGRAVVTLRSASAQSAALTVHDMLGRRVATLFEGRLPAGNSSCVFDAHALPSGPYHLVLRTPDGTQTERIMLLG